MRPPLFYRVLNRLRRWSEDRQAGEANLMEQMRTLRNTRRQECRYLRLVRGERGRVESRRKSA